MAEQRLIDANTFAEAWNHDSQLGKTMRAVIAEQPTIDPETMPIVRKLRKELAKVTAERDAAVGLLKRVNDETGNCYGCKYFDIERRACTDREKKVFCNCGENNMWEWRGPQKEE